MIDADCINAWRINYGLDTHTPEAAMSYWSERCAGMVPAGAVAALGLCLLEIERLQTDWMAITISKLRNLATHEHESKEAFIARVNAVLTDSDPNSCKQCGGALLPGIALEQMWTEGITDFPGQNTCVTMSPGGPGQLIDCMKCEACGWSRT